MLKFASMFVVSGSMICAGTQAMACGGQCGGCQPTCTVSAAACQVPAAAPAPQPAPPAPATAASPQGAQTYRSYSFDPGPGAPVYSPPMMRRNAPSNSAPSNLYRADRKIRGIQ
jgi:hypothetical protein